MFIYKIFIPVFGEWVERPREYVIDAMKEWYSDSVEVEVRLKASPAVGKLKLENKLP